MGCPSSRVARTAVASREAAASRYINSSPARGSTWPDPDRAPLRLRGDAAPPRHGISRTRPRGSFLDVDGFVVDDSRRIDVDRVRSAHTLRLGDDTPLIEHRRPRRLL